MFSFNKIALYFLLLFIFSCNNDINNFKRIQGNALGTSYSIIVDTDIKEHLIKEKIENVDIPNAALIRETKSLANVIYIEDSNH